MAGERLIGAVDQGTTGTRFMLFDHAGRVRSRAYREHRQIFPRPGWVEHDAAEIWRNTQVVIAEGLRLAGASASDVAAVGVTNQRETVVVWDATTGEPVHNAIVWQDRRTADDVRGLERQGRSEDIRARTGLTLDPYFSASKLAWLLREVPGLRTRAERGELRAGTIDTWLIWRLTGAHVTDATNASRTMLFGLKEMDWDPDLLALFGVPRELLPEVRPSSEVYGEIDLAALAGVPLAGNLGDQQAALFGQACFGPGDTKNTYGTGSFLLRNTATQPVPSRHGLLTTVAYHLPGQPPCYALEGSVFITGAAVQWLRDGLKVIESASQTEALARSVPDTDGVYFVPAFTGLGAPYWQADARGTIVGLTRGTTVAHLARAALEAIAYQTRDVVDAMAADVAAAGLAEDTPQRPLKVDGGAAANGFLCQFQSDLLGVPVVRPAVVETTALGAAFAAGLAAGYWHGQDEIRSLWQADRTFEPALDATARDGLYEGWKTAVRAALSWADEASARQARDA